MQYLFERLEWKPFMTSTKIPYSELDKYADVSFPNGVHVRIVTGRMADTNVVFPYEANVIYPQGDNQKHERLDKRQLNELLNKLKAVPNVE